MDYRKRKRSGVYSQRHVRRLIQQETERLVLEGQSLYLCDNSLQMEEWNNNNDTVNIDEKSFEIYDKVVF